MISDSALLVRLEGVSKTFGHVKANRDKMAQEKAL